MQLQLGRAKAHVTELCRRVPAVFHLGGDEAGPLEIIRRIASRVELAARVAGGTELGGFEADGAHVARAKATDAECGEVEATCVKQLVACESHMTEGLSTDERLEMPSPDDPIGHEAADLQFPRHDIRLAFDRRADQAHRRLARVDELFCRRRLLALLAQQVAHEEDLRAHRPTRGEEARRTQRLQRLGALSQLTDGYAEGRIGGREDQSAERR